MNIRFTMFPLETQLLPIYERLLSCPERAAARALRALLYLSDTASLPAWFEQMPRKPFPSTRAKTIRLSIPSPMDEPALGYLYKRLEPLGNAERINVLKGSLVRMLNPQPLAQIPEISASPSTTHSQSSMLMVMETPNLPAPISTGSTTKVESEESLANRAKKLKMSANIYR